ncbi:type II toxin-antitoxin system HicA family toxin [Chryseobacterium gleum]|uniref:type II toxin-antitoxin system HicA family toxin n=1 Tax=Chryseobacterium gleum TaxID=250 RepID=UPI00241C7D71|nr:type II toxin-antitoxin system HicA family toxin [Chryseobacterium gleum]
MSKAEKLKSRLQNKPTDFKYSELKTLLESLGYSESKKGKTSGSRVRFVNESLPSIINLHKPHKPDILKEYQIKAVLEELANHNLL